MVQLTKHDLSFILKQIKISEAHAAGGDLAKLVAEAGLDAGAVQNGTPLQAHLLPYGLRTVDGSYNNLLDGQERWGASGKPFTPLVDPKYINEQDDQMAFGPSTVLNNNDYTPGAGSALGPGTVVDADPRLISNLIVDQTSNNPAAIIVYEAMLAEGKNATRTQLLDSDGDPVVHTQRVLGGSGEILANIGDPVWIYTFENVSPDIGDSAPYNSLFTLFGQFFDHGLDLVAKGGAGTVYIPLSPDDPLYNPATPHTNFMVMTRASRDANGEVAANVTTPWVDQNQTYTSHASHQVFLREYVMHEGRPIATGHLLEGDRGLSTWADVKQQAREMLGIDLTDADVGSVPLLRTDPYGNFIPDANGFAQVIVGLGVDGIPNTADDDVVSGTPGAPVSTANAVRIPNAFLDDIAHAAAPVSVGGVLQADDDDAVGYSGGFNERGQQTAYDDELLDAHYITGDGRGNENVGLTTIHHVFHSEHNEVVEQTKQVALESGDLAFLNEWLLVDVATIPTDPAAIAGLVWDGERLFQAGRFTTEMEYQHLVFEEFGRKMQPDIDAFLFEPSADIDPAIFAEFAHAVYRFGHSMLNQDIDRLVENPDGSFSFDNISLFDGFLNPLGLGAVDAAGNVIVDHDTAAGAIIRGMSRQGGNEIDEFVTDVLRNQLVGIPLDLAALNLARGRDVGLPSLNEARAQFYQAAGQDSQLKAYTSWTDFALNMQNPASIINFIAAYGTHDLVANETTLEGKRAAAMTLVFGAPHIVYGAATPADDRLITVPADRLDFLNGTGTWAGDAALGGVNDIDLWIGGLAEKKMDFGGMLGSTFAFVFELQMENLQDADRFYYLSRVQGLNLLNELENNSLAKMMMRNTDLGGDGRTALPGDIFSTPDHILEMDMTKQVGADPTFSDPFLQALSPLVVRRDLDGDGDIDSLVYNGGAHVVIGGTDEADHIVAGEGDDTIWGWGGDDTLEGGYGVDHIHGGAGDDIITNAGTDIGAADFLHGEGGNDVIHGGSGLALIFGNEGNDFIVAGPDGKHVLGGLGNDFILGGDGGDFLMGNEDDDWIEGGGRFDTLAGENSELFFNSSIIGHDVLNGGSSDTDYDAESGDDIMFQNAGIQRSNGMAGFDWAVHKGDNAAANSDLGIPLFTTQEAFILRDRFDLVEGLSGWKYNDTLTGRITPTNARAELQNTAAIPGADSPLDSYSNALLEKNVALISGLDLLVAHKARSTVTVAGVTETIVMDTADASDILLGGGGSDVITGLGGDDIIDGDRWLNVRIEVRDALGNAIGSADGMATKVLAADGSILFGGRTLDALMFDRTLNPGQLNIVREILDGDATGDVDIAVYTDIVDNYSFARNADGSITVTHSGFDDDDGEGPDGEDIPEETGVNRISDGSDRLFNIEVLRFSDGNGGTVEIALDDLPFPNAPATGAPAISDLTPTEGQALTVDVSSIADAEGTGALSYRWQASSDGGTTWTNIAAGGTGASFTPAGGQVGGLLRVVVSFTDGDGNAETLVSAPTGIVGDNWDAIPFLANNFNGTEGDDIADGTSGALFGLGANDTLNGNGGNDILNGAGGADMINGGAGNDVVNGGAGNDTLLWNAGGGRDMIDGAAGTDTVRVTGDATAETFGIYTRAEAVTAGFTGLAVATEIVLTRNGAVIAELDNIEEIVINTLNVTANDGGGLNQGGNSGDLIQVFGNFAGTSLNYSTITIEGSQADDIVDLTALQSAHRVVFRSGGGNDVIIGQMRAQDRFELAEGKTLDDYVATDNENGSTTLATAGHSVTFFGTLANVQTAGNGSQPNDDDDDDDTVSTPPPSDDDTLTGTAGRDTLKGGSGDDVISGLAGDDVIDGGSGDDVLNGNDGDDRLNGGSGDDVLVAGDGDDELTGGSGDDRLAGGDGDDRLSGGSGDDRLDGGEGDDVMTGGGGEDNFVFGSGDDRVTDFDVDEDLIDLSGLGVTAQSFASRVVISQSGNDTLVRLDGQTMRLDAVSAADVQNASFIFAAGGGGGSENGTPPTTPTPQPTDGTDAGSTPNTPDIPSGAAGFANLVHDLWGWGVRSRFEHPDRHEAVRGDWDFV